MGNVFHEDVKSAGDKGYHTEWNKAHKVNAPTEAGDVATKTYVDSKIVVPIGTVLAWMKTFANTPALPDGFVECNGQVLSDGDSVYNGQTIPDLNGDNRFLRGNATSGGVGGESTHHLSIAEMPEHNHQINVGHGTGAVNFITDDNVYIGSYTIQTTLSGGGGAHENKPPFYNMVWIMRIK